MTSPTQTHETFHREEAVKGSSDRVFGLVFAGFFTLVAVWPWIFSSGPVRLWAVGVAAAFAAVAVVAPRMLGPANKAWMRFGLLLSKVMNPLVLGLLFFATVMPIGLLMRALGKDLLRLKFDRNATTYWIEREPPGPAPDTMRNQF